MNTTLKSLLNLLLVAAVSVALLWGADTVTRSVIAGQESDRIKADFAPILAAETYTALPTAGHESVTAAYRAEDRDGTLLGYAVTATVKGYGGPLTVYVALSPDGERFLGLRVGSHQETEGYGARVTEEAFYRQFDSLAAPASVGGYTGLEDNGSASSSGSGTSAANWKDGTYRAEENTYNQGYRSFVELTVRDGKITAVNWDADKEGADVTKKQESQAGHYVMTEDGLLWHQQAAAMEQALMETQDPAKLIFNQDTGKTDAYAGVSVDVSAFVSLSAQALEKAAGTGDGLMDSAGSAGTVDAVSGATVSSKAVVKAANSAYTFVQALLKENR